MDKLPNTKYIPLNTAESEDTGMIQVRYDFTDVWGKLDVIIWDCHKKIELDFFFDSLEKSSECLKKIVRLRETLDFMEECILEYENNLKERDE